MPTRILFVEDNVNTSKAMKVMLELKGFSVETALTVREAVEKLGDETFDVLISDIGLPDGSGYDILQKTGKSVPAIALSGYTSEKDRAEGLSKGFQEFLTKPFQITELVSTIDKVKR